MFCWKNNVGIYFVFLGLFQTYLLSCVVQEIRSEEHFSRSQSEILVYKRISGISITSCSKGCKARQNCKQAIYNRAAKVCSLTKGTATTTGIVQKGQILMSGFDEIRKADPMCGDTVCSSHEACVKENNNPICKVTECTQLQSASYKASGNINEVNSKIYVEYVSSNIQTTITCNETGKWIGDVFQNCCHIGCLSGVCVLTTTRYLMYSYNIVNYFCDMDTDGGHWVVFQRRRDGSENFYRNWFDYAHGFGNVEGEYWLGLFHMYNILKTGNFELRIELESFEGERRYAKYSTFSIDAPSASYRLNVSGYSGNATDSLSRHNGKMFSTFDKDNDVYKGNCAILYKGGWWYGKCHSANLNGLYYNGGENTTIYAQHIHWRSWLGYWNSLKTSEMKFRRLP